MIPTSLRSILSIDRHRERSLPLLFGFIVTLLWLFTYQPLGLKILIGFTSLIALFSIIQTARNKPAYLLLFPAAFILCIFAIAISNGTGSHDLVWSGLLGVMLFLIFTEAGNSRLIIPIFGILGLSAFIIIGVLEMNGAISNPFKTDFQYLALSSLLLGSLSIFSILALQHYRLLIKNANEAQEREQIARQGLQTQNQKLKEQNLSRIEELAALNEKLLSKTAKLEAAFEISRELAIDSTQDVNLIFTKATRLISEKLGYYHAGIFTLDTLRQFAVLRSANSKGGQSMLANRHKLKVGGAGIVGYVSQSGRPRIALDAGADAVFFNNPSLPDTRSEISLPIKVGNSILGVLDVQSTQPAAFDQEDVSTLMIIANQIAVLLQMDPNPEMPVSNPRRNLPAIHSAAPSGYTYDPDENSITKTSMEYSPSMQKALDSGGITIQRTTENGKSVLVVPVKYREKIIGIINIEAANRARGWSEDEILMVQSISDRAGFALENAALFEDATHRAEQEETISRITNQIGSSTTFERIMQTTIQELGVALGASRSFIQLNSNHVPEGQDPE